MKSTQEELPTDLPSDSLVPLESVLCTEELNARPTRPPDYESENRALVSLAQALAESPPTILQRLADQILELLRADSAGLSLLTKEDGGKRFYWPAIAGMWKPHIGGGTPRDFGPCGDVLDRNAPLLFRHFERRYTYFLPVTPPVEECLLVPFYVEGKAVGTIWAIAHDDRRKFDAEDMRQLVSLGRFASSAYRAIASLEALEQQGERLRQKHAELAQSLAEHRKASLQAQDSHRAALNLMEDAVLNRQAIETLNVELRESEERFRGIFAQALAGIALADLTGQFVQVNQRYCDIVGRSAEELYRLRLHDLTHPEDLPRNLELFWPMVEGNGPPFVIETRYVRPDESVVWVSNSVNLVKDRDGKPKHVVGVSLDITDRKRAEESLIESDRRKNEFLAMLAHELRNPMAPIRSALEVLQLTKGNEEVVRSATEMMKRQIGQMVRLVDDLLDVSRISRGKIELRKGSIELASTVNHAVEAARALLQGKGLDLTVTLPPRPVYLDADPVRLAQVLGNLLNNACKFTDKGGRIWLTAEVSSEGHPEEILIRVRDTGVGIAAEQLPRIFDMFTQVDTSLERTDSGLGIGLTLAKNLVELHGGTLEVHSAGAGQGSEFVVHLPSLAEAPKPPPPQLAVSKPPARACCVLVVDDNVDSVEILTILLNLSGHEAHIAHDGLEAMEAAGKFRPDVILLDIGLPKLNGYDVARRIREQPWGKSMVLVALTGWGQDEDRHRSRQAGFNHHMTKPVDPDVLSKLLSSLPVRPERAS
jgi:PAS domain S-box-containing protein